MKKGSRLGGVIHDVYMMRRGEPVFTPSDNVRAVQREKLLHSVNILLMLIEDIDDLEFSNPRIGVVVGGAVNALCICARFVGVGTNCVVCSLPKKVDPPANAFGGGVGGCPCGCGRTIGFCLYGRTFPEKEQASITTSLADLREPQMVAKLCECEEPGCNDDAKYPKPCYACGGIVTEPECKRCGFRTCACLGGKKTL